MAASRRTFIRLAGLGGVALTADACASRSGVAPAPEIATGATAATPATGAARPLRLGSNENSFGPGERVLTAIRDVFDQSNRYPFASSGQLRDALASQLGVEEGQVVLSCGSGEILDAAVTAFTTPEAGLVTARPTFESPEGRARQLGHPVAAVKIDSSFALDLDAMTHASAGAGLLYLCNPNNPTGTVHGARAIADVIDRVNRTSPQTMILVDEAYHEYVASADYQTAVPIALANPDVVVSRTFSKIYGMAGLRVGYAIGQPPTLRRLQRFLGDGTMSRLSMAAALAALAEPARVEEQRHLNEETRAFTVKMLTAAGYPPIPSNTNFVMVDVKREIRSFQAACYERGVAVARPFPPLLTHARITIGTPDEMRRAAEVFREVFASPTTYRAPDRDLAARLAALNALPAC
jgi:histidinol-phosphate aminotransferase